MKFKKSEKRELKRSTFELKEAVVSIAAIVERVDRFLAMVGELEKSTWPNAKNRQRYMCRQSCVKSLRENNDGRTKRKAS